jgi:two-component system cell cycle sensor histidine kinase/response regulator CckA
MNKPRIMLVEDEKVVAADIQECVKGLGYEVVGAAATGTEALRLAVDTMPDLVLMDIKLKGALDGIDVAGALYDQLKIPVVYLTAHADAEILERARQTAPSGYVLKPFDDRTLRTAIELAFDRHRRERQLIDGGQRMAAAIGSIDEAVIVTARERPSRADEPRGRSPHGLDAGRGPRQTGR